MAEEQKYPVFKSEGGAFDRAKFNEDAIKNAGSISSDTIDAMKAANNANKAAKIFYNSTYSDSLKSIDPAYSTDKFYDYAFSPTGKDRREIGKKIDSGEAVDGKEIVEKAKSTALIKNNNANKLKNSNVVSLIESLGTTDIKSMDAYETVGTEFNDATGSNEKYDFETLLSKFMEISDMYQENLTTETAKILYSPENNAVISALAKILEQEGLINDSVKEAAKGYEEALKKLGSGESGSIESAISSGTSNTEESNTTPQNLNSEEKLEEKNSPQGETSSTLESSLESVKSATDSNPATPMAESIESGESLNVATNINKDLDSVNQPESTTTEQNLNSNVETNSTQSSEISPIESNTNSSIPENTLTSEVTPEKIVTKEEIKTTSEKNIEGNSVTSPNDSNVDTKENTAKKESFFESLFGIKLGGNKETTNKSEGAKKMIESLGIKIDSPIDSKIMRSELETGSTEIKSVVNKLGENLPGKPETSSVSNPIKETESQNLSSVVPFVKENNEESSVESKPVNTVKESKEQNEGSKESEEVKKNIEDLEENKENKEEIEQMRKEEKEMRENIKNMVFLLSQLNNTLQNPLIVIPNEKKFV